MNTPLFFLTIAVLLGTLQLAIHRVEEGHVGVYWRGGALVDRITYPGWHLKVPIVDTFENVQITMQTDKVTDIPCGTSGGVLLWFERIEVVNRLKEKYVYSTIKNYTVNYDKIWIFDKIHHEINQFCSKHTLQEIYIDLFHTVDDRLQQALQESCDKWAPGIEIISIRVTKPKIPDSILRNYEQMEAEKTRLLVSIEGQKVVQKQAETEKLKATIEAEKQAAVSKIEMETLVAEEESRKKVLQIQDEAMLIHKKALVDAETYKLTNTAQSNKALISPEYLQLELIRSIGNSTKIYFGPSLNSLFLDFVEMMTKAKTTTPAS